ncbi:HNH endonuclease signature motif containing protein [Acidipropionibacterium virtanenii]|nr:HNH endonuclease signature motif containing protein [Acidipropionibacterium virtanenii]
MSGKRNVWQTVKVIEEALDLLDRSCAATMNPAQTLAAMRAMRRLADRMCAEAAVWTDRAAKTCAAEKAAGTPLSDYLAVTEGRSSSEANGLVHQAGRITADPRVRDAALAGTVSPNKAAAAGAVLRDLPRHDMSEAQRRAAAERLIDQAAGGATTGQIARSADRVLEQVAPDLAPTPDGRAAEAERRRRRAVRERELTFVEDGRGSVRFWGRLPQMEGDLLRTVVGACVERGRGDERRELETLKAQRATGELSAGQYFAARTVLGERESRTTAQRQADAITDMVTALQSAGQVPVAGGEAPRVVVTLDYTRLLQLAVEAAATGLRPDGTMLDEVSVARLRTAVTGTTETGADVAASQVRLACCDAGILPTVLGQASEILDVGREHRLVTPQIRKALTLRDSGCVFPGCTVPAPACQAHHVIPWWAGGPTSLNNLVLICRHHHGVIEPHRFAPAADQWRITFDPDTGRPQVHPPRRLRHDLPPGPDAGEDSAHQPETETGAQGTLIA